MIIDFHHPGLGLPVRLWLVIKFQEEKGGVPIRTGGCHPRAGEEDFSRFWEENVGLSGWGGKPEAPNPDPQDVAGVFLDFQR